MNGQLQHVEVWSDLQCAGGVRLAVLAAVVGVSEGRQLTGDDQLTVKVEPGTPGAEALANRRVLRVVDNADDFDEWRLASASYERQEQASLVLEAVSPLRELTDRCVVRRVDGFFTVVQQFEALGLTIAEHLESFILPSLAEAGQAWWAAGTISSAVPVQSFVYDWSTPMDALRRLAESIRGSTGLALEVQVRRVGTTGYVIDVLDQIGASAATVQVRLGKNLLGTRRAVSSDNQATRIYGRGGTDGVVASDMSGAAWVVTGLVGNVVTLADPMGGAGPVGFDDQLNDYLLLSSNLTPTLITDSVAATQVLTVTDASALALGMRVYFRDPAVRSVMFLDHPVRKASDGVKVAVLDRSDLPSTSNLVPNAAMRDWPVGQVRPTKWLTVGSGVTVTRETDPIYTRYGGQSVRLQTTQANSGIVTDFFAIVPYDSQPYFSGLGLVWPVAGRVRIELWFDNGLVRTIRPSGTDAVASTGDQLATWVELGFANVDAMKLGATQMAVAFLQDGPAAVDVYVDGAQVTQTIGQRPFLEGCGATLLWQAVNERLALYADPSVTIDTQLVDVQRADAARFPYDQLVLGGRVMTVDEELNVWVETRMVGFTRDLTRGLVTQVQLSNLPNDLTDALVRPTRPNPITRRQDTGSELTVQAFWTEQALLSSVTMRLAAQPEDAVVYYLMLDETDPVPAMGDAAWMLYTGPRTIDATDSTVKVVAYAQLGGKLSRVYTWMVDAGRTASLLAVTAATPSSGVVRLSWVPDVDTQRVDIYQVIDWSGDGYPTSDGTTSGTMIGVARVAQIGVDALAGGTYNGTARSGGTTLDVSGLTTGQVVGWGLVPFDRYGRVGDVAFLKYTVPASPSAALLSWNFDSIDTSGATDKGTVSWTPNALVTTSHKLRFTLLAQDYVYEVATITNPVGTTSAVLDMGVVHSTAKNSARYTFSWKIDLLTSANVLVGSYKTKGLTDTVLELAL